MRRLIKFYVFTALFILALIFACKVRASDPALPVLIITDKGYSWMIVGNDGKPTLYEFSQVIVLGKPTITPPSGGSSFGLESAIKPLIANLPPSGKADLPAVLQGVKDTSDMAIAGKFKTLGEVEAVAAALLRVAIKDKASWGPVALAIDDALVKLQKDGKIVTPTDYGKALAELVKALQ